MNKIVTVSINLNLTEGKYEVKFSSNDKSEINWNEIRPILSNVLSNVESEIEDSGKDSTDKVTKMIH